MDRSGPAGRVLSSDPDARFLLANERTLLAYVRTALTLQAGGIGVLQFVTRIGGASCRERVSYHV